MSSDVTEASLHDGGKLLVHIAENGHSYELDCDDSTPVEAVMRFIESTVSGLSFNDQLVLRLDMKLEPNRLLSTYKLPDDDREVFIFNKSKLLSNSPLPPPEKVEAFDIADPPLPSSSIDPHPLDDASDPALKALASYERLFRYHYHWGHAIYSRTQVKYENCERLWREQKVQERALEVARGNLDQFYRILNQNYSEFMKRYSMQHRIHSDLLVNFGRDLEKLRSIKLHSVLQSETRKSLSDFVKEDNLRKSVENCTSSHRQFENKVSQFRQMFSEVKCKVEELFSSKSSLPIKNLEMMIKEHRRYIDEQKSLMQSLSKDVNTVKKLVDDCLSCQLSSSLRPHDAVSALGPMYDVHDKSHLPRMQTCDRAISKLAEFCRDRKNEMNIFVHNYMQKIMYATHIIKDAKLQFPVFKEAMVRQDDLFVDLKLVRRIGPAYRACLAEVVRRKASMKLYMGMVGQLAEKLATKREDEVRRREIFLKDNSLYIPRDILASMGLYDVPSQCDVNIAPFDTGLLDIDITDLDRYAPEYLAGFPSKNEKQGTMKGSFSMSNDSSLSAEAVVISEDALEKYDCGDLFEGYDLLEIAGTSKMEVENAKLKAELASAIALICSFSPEADYELLDDSKLDTILKDSAEKTAEALHLKDEYGKHLQSMLKMKQMQCLSYEKRIQELEQRLSDQYLQGKNLSNDNVSNFEHLADKANNYKQEISGGEAHMPFVSSSEPMDEMSCISNPLDVKLGRFNRQPSRDREGVDENMIDSSGMLNNQLDSSMLEPRHEELLGQKDGKDKMLRQLMHSSTAESIPESKSLSPGVGEQGLESKDNGDLVLELQGALTDKANQLSDTEAKLKTAMEEVVMLRRELEMSQKLLDESQMNCAHLENCLHEAREEAQTHLCAADRRASEYSVLRASAVKMHGLFERLRSCVYAPGGVAGFVDSLRALAQSLSNSINENEDDSTIECRKCICVLANRVGLLSRHHEELLGKYPKIEAANEHLKAELEEKGKLLKTLYAKHQLEKQLNKERISFGSLEVHEIAAFVLNSGGHYEAVNQKGSKYYLSAESVALFADHLPNKPSYIVGQVVHVERQTVKPPPPPQMTSDDRLTLNPYGLPVGCEYFVVTVAMLPDTTTIRSSPPF